MLKVLVLVLALSFAYQAYDLHKAILLDLHSQSANQRRYTEVMIRESEYRAFQSLNDVTKATGMLARILCQQERSREDCAALLPDSPPALPHPDPPPFSFEQFRGNQ